MRENSGATHDRFGAKSRFLADKRRLVWLALGLLFLLLLFQVNRSGGNVFLLFAGGLTAATALLYFSLRNVYVPLMLWAVSILGPRHFLIYGMPSLPDLSPDRVLLIYALLVIMLRTVVRGGALPKLSWLDVLIITHAVYLFVSCLILSRWAFNTWSKTYLMGAAAYFFGQSYFSNSRWLGRIFFVLMMLNVYHAVTAIAEHYNWSFLVWPKIILDRSVGFQDPGRSRGLFMQPAVLGTAMAMVLPIQFYFWIKSRSLLARISALVSIVIVAPALLYTYTRANWIAASAALLALLAIGWRRYSTRVLQLSGVAAILLFAGFISFASDEFLHERLSQEGTITGRINTLATAYRMFRDNPLFGVGLNMYVKESQNYREPINVPFFGLIKSQWDKTGSPHDIYIGALAEEGLIGMGMQVAIYFGIFSFAFRHRRLHRNDKEFTDYLYPVYIALAAAYLVGGLGFDYRHFETLSGMFYLTSGAIIAYKSDSDQKYSCSGPILMSAVSHTS